MIDLEFVLAFGPGGLVVKAVLVPLGVLIVLGVATDIGRKKFAAFSSYFMSSDAVKPDTGKIVVDSHFNEMSLNEKLNWIDLQGRDLFGELHTWELTGFTPEAAPGKIMNANPVSPQVTSRWNERFTLKKSEEAEVVAENYNHIRRYYSLVKWRVRQLEGQTDQAVRDLPDEARLDSAFRAERNLQQTTFAIRDLDRALKIFEEKVKPYFR